VSVRHDLDAERSVDAVVWTCEVCGQEIADAEGYVTVSFADLAEHDHAAKTWDEAHPVAGDRVRAVTLREFISYPSPARWQVLHRRCDPDLEVSAYWIGTERIRTAADVIAWAAQLGEKSWIQRTDWSGLLRGIAGRLGGSL
jgi:hypothetical protein